MRICSDCKVEPTLAPYCSQCRKCWDAEAQSIAEVCGKSPGQLAAELTKNINDRLGELPAENNHVCPHCDNDKCSKSEKSCWKCGGKLK